MSATCQRAASGARTDRSPAPFPRARWGAAGVLQRRSVSSASFEGREECGDVLYVLVGIAREQLIVTREWIGDLDFRRVAVAADGPCRAGSQCARHQKVIYAGH